MTGHPSKHLHKVMTRFTDEQIAAIHAARPEDEELAAFVRRMALTGVAGGGGPDAAFRRAVAFVVGVLSPDYSPDQALAMLDEYLAEGATTP